MNTRLSMGNMSNEGIVTCPFHGARFDATTGKNVKEPVLTPSQEMEPLPKTWQSYLEHAGELMSYIKTYDQQTYEVPVEGKVKGLGHDNRLSAFKTENHFCCSCSLLYM